MKRIMFVVGIILAITSALLLIIDSSIIYGASPIVMGIIGVVLIGASKVRLLN